MNSHRRVLLTCSRNSSISLLASERHLSSRREHETHNLVYHTRFTSAVVGKLQTWCGRQGYAFRVLFCLTVLTQILRCTIIMKVTYLRHKTKEYSHSCGVAVVGGILCLFVRRMKSGYC